MNKIPLIHSVFEVSLDEIKEIIDDHIARKKNYQYQGFVIIYRGSEENTLYWSQPESSAFFPMDKKLSYQSFHDYYSHDDNITEVKISYEFHPMLGFIYDSLESKIYTNFKVRKIPLILERDSEKDLFQEYMKGDKNFYKAWRHEKQFDLRETFDSNKSTTNDSNKRKGRKSEFTREERHKAVKDYLDIPKNEGTTLSSFLENRFGFEVDGSLKVAETTFYDWIRKYKKNI